MGSISGPLICCIYYFFRMLTERVKNDGGNKNINININQCIAMVIKNSNLTHRSENGKTTIIVITVIILISNNILVIHY